MIRLSKIIVSGLFLLALLSSAFAESTRLLSDKVGKFKLRPAASSMANIDHGASVIGTDQGEYVGNNGERFLVEIVRFRQDADAYELLSLRLAAFRAKNSALEIRPDYGTAGFATEDAIFFFKGPHFIRLRNSKGTDTSSLNGFARELSDTLDRGDGDIPVLIKHLPNPDEAQKNAIYLNSFAELNALGLQQPVLSAVESGGNADAALAAYGPSKLLILEFNTPQLATENDKRIIARIHELWKLGQPAPSAYHRVGNYSVFVFDAPDEQSAKQLIDQVKYEQVVQWLGENPNIYKEAQKRYINTTLGVLVAVIKASGYALVACLGLGGLFGALLFTHRRGQQKSATAFSDAGGMLRLNLDELTANVPSNRRLKSAD